MKDFENLDVLETDFNQYKSVEDLKARLDKIKQMSFRNYSRDQIVDLLLRDLCFIPVNVAYLDPELFNSRIFYRVRLNIGQWENIHSDRTYSYPPPQVCKANGRANVRNSSVFYCSEFAHTSLWESRPKTGDFGSIAVWKGHTNRKIKVGFFLLEDIKKENPWSEMAFDFHAKLKEHHGLNQSDKHAFTQEITKFIAERFMYEKPDYPITSCIAHQAMFGEKIKDMLAYPSNVHEGSVCNYAFHPECVDSFLHLVKVIRFKVTEVKDGDMKYIPGNVGEYINGKMYWRRFRQDEADFENLPPEIKFESP